MYRVIWSFTCWSGCSLNARIHWSLNKVVFCISNTILESQVLRIESGRRSYPLVTIFDYCFYYYDYFYDYLPYLPARTVQKNMKNMKNINVPGKQIQLFAINNKRKYYPVVG